MNRSTLSIVGFVVGCALLGLLLGGVFGLVAGSISPHTFVMPLAVPVEEAPRAATVLGAFGGTLCGGALGVFAVLARVVQDAIRSRDKERA